MTPPLLAPTAPTVHLAVRPPLRRPPGGVVLSWALVNMRTVRRQGELAWEGREGR